MSWLFASGGQSIGASASVLPMNIQGSFSLGLTGLTSLQFKGLSRVFSNTTDRKYQFSSAQPSFWLHPYVTTGKTVALTIYIFVGVTTGKTIALTIHIFVGKVMSLLFNMLSRFVILLTFFPRMPFNFNNPVKSVSCSVVSDSLQPHRL